MPYRIEMLVHTGRMREADVGLSKVRSFSVLARRQGLDNQYDIYRKADEAEKRPLCELSVPEHISEHAVSLVQEYLFKPQYLLNLIRLGFEEGKLRVVANSVNYGSYAILAELAGIYHDGMFPVMSQVAPIAINAVIVSNAAEAMFVSQRRQFGKNGGMWETFPTGLVDARQNLRSALRLHTSEETFLSVGVNARAQASLVGVSRGTYHTGGPNFNYLLETDVSFEYLVTRMGVEHDAVIPIYLNPNAVRNYLFNSMVKVGSEGKDYIVDAAVAAILQVGKTIFGDKWYADTVGTLRDRSDINFELVEVNPFADNPIPKKVPRQR